MIVKSTPNAALVISSILMLSNEFLLCEMTKLAHFYIIDFTNTVIPR